MKTVVVITQTEKDRKNAVIRQQIMDLRDHRYRLYKEIAKLEDKQVYEPANFTPDDAYWLYYHKADVARIKAEETRLRALIH